MIELGWDEDRVDAIDDARRERLLWGLYARRLAGVRSSVLARTAFDKASADRHNAAITAMDLELFPRDRR